MVIRLLEDRPETVWELLADAAAVPSWLSHADAGTVPAAGTPAWPAPGARIDYRAGRRRRVVTVVVVDHQPRRGLTVAVSRPLLGSALLGRAVIGSVLVGVDLQPAPVFRTGIHVRSRRFDIRRGVPGSSRVVGERPAGRMVDDLVAELRRRGPVMFPPTGPHRRFAPARR